MEQTMIKKCNHGQNVKRWREWRGINQDVLAEKIGVSQATMSGYEKKETLEEDVLAKIAEELDIPVEAITELGVDAAINIITGAWHDNSSVINFNPIEKVVELYERMLKAEQEKVALLQEVLREKK